MNTIRLPFILQFLRIVIEKHFESIRKITQGVTLVFVIIISLLSCGGVVGNIEKYPFPNTNSNNLKSALNRVYIKYHELQKNDTSMYGMNDGEKFYFLFIHESETYVFKCHIVEYQDVPDKSIELSLTTSTTWGKRMKLASKIGFFEKRKYRKLFEQNILPKIKEQLSQGESLE